MENRRVQKFVESVLENMPSDWLELTTHRLDIYDEELAKTQFLEKLNGLFNDGDTSLAALRELPTAYDYIRLGHPLSCLLEWVIAKLGGVEPDRVISFSSKTTPILAVLRKNFLEDRSTTIAFAEALPAEFSPDVVRRVYGYNFELVKIEPEAAIGKSDGCTLFVSDRTEIDSLALKPNVDIRVNTLSRLGSVLTIANGLDESYIADIQHVRRRETIAMTPADCVAVLRNTFSRRAHEGAALAKSAVLKSIATVTGVDTDVLVGSSGLSIQYAIMMGLVDDALTNHPGKAARFIVPPNCYGGTNDQARRVAECVENVEIVDLLVDGENDMVDSIDTILAEIAKQDAVPYIIAEIPTNPRVEVPDLLKLKEVLGASRTTAAGGPAVAPVFILDQTFCPNVHFLGESDILSTVKSISYVSGSKFPSGGRCTAGYCVGNSKADALMKTIGVHLRLCDNEATDLQLEVLAEQLPSMVQRIGDAYKNTREFVEFVRQALPDAKINFVSSELAAQGFTPSVFSLELPTKGESDEDKEAYRRELNLRLINMMISAIPDESKFCVSYGQLKGCYWTVPATSTQGTTKESDKDYIVRVSLSPLVDLERHKTVFSRFVETM